MKDFANSIPQTLYSGPFYANLILRGKGIGWKYIFLQTFLFAAFVAFALLWQYGSVSAIQADIDSFFAQIPGITVKNNQLSLDRPSPVTVRVPSDNGDFFVVFDTTPRPKEDAKILQEMQSKKIIALFTTDYIAMLENANLPPEKQGIDYQDYSEYDNLTISHDQLVEFGKTLLPSFAFVGMGGIFFFTIVGNFFKALLIQLSSLFFKRKPAFSDSMRLAAAASIPVGLLRIFLVPFHLAIPPHLGLLIALAFAVFGIAAANKDARAAGSS